MFRRRWNEIIDVARRVRWREPSLVLGLLPDGTPIGSDVRANAWPEPSWFHRAFTVAIE